MHPAPGPPSLAPATLSVTNVLPLHTFESQAKFWSPRSQAPFERAVLLWRVLPKAPASTQIPRVFRVAVLPWIVLKLALWSEPPTSIPVVFSLSVLYWTVLWADPMLILMPHPFPVAELYSTVFPLQWS